MPWLWLGVAAVLVIAAFALWRAFSNPRFVAGLTSIAVSAAWKAVAPKIAKRMSPEQEKAWRDCIRSGGEWDHVKKRCKR
jgi:hypothetical protein